MRVGFTAARFRQLQDGHLQLASSSRVFFQPLVKVGLPVARFISFPGFPVLAAKPSLAMGEQWLVSDGLSETSQSDKADGRKHRPCASA